MVEGAILSPKASSVLPRPAPPDLREFFTLTAPRAYHLIPADKNATFFLALPTAVRAHTPDKH